MTSKVVQLGTITREQFNYAGKCWTFKSLIKMK